MSDKAEPRPWETYWTLNAIETKREGLFVCHNCTDGLHSDCVGVPCQCECPLRVEEEQDYSI
jgi:hypothetical protein